jgi:hypothetical protein
VNRTTSLSSFLRRAVVTGCAAAFTVAALGSTQASASTAKRHPTINTYKFWKGSRYIWPFGCSNTTTYGQVITVPSGKSHLRKFVFAWRNYSGSGSMVVRGEVYAWAGSKATGASLFESAPRTIAFGDSVFHKEGFRLPGGIAVTPRQKYVIFASIAKDYEQCTDSYELAWGGVPDSKYARGTFVYQNNGGDESQWTSSGWTTNYGIDLAFKAYLGS